MQDVSKTNQGFLFKSNHESALWQILKDLIQHTQSKDILMHFWVLSENLAAGPGEDLIVKYLSALLLVQPKCDNIIRLIEAQIHAGKDAELELNKAELVCKKAKFKCKKEECIEGRDSSLSWPISPETVGWSGRAEVGDEASSNESGFGIKHQYVSVGVIIFDDKHPLIVMLDVGSTLGTSIWEEMNEGKLQVRWRNSPKLRRAFAKDVGESALNLVDTLHICHNDIWRISASKYYDLNQRRFVLSHWIWHECTRGGANKCTCAEAFLIQIPGSSAEDVLCCANCFGSVSTWFQPDKMENLNKDDFMCIIDAMV